MNSTNIDFIINSVLGTEFYVWIKWLTVKGAMRHRHLKGGCITDDTKRLCVQLYVAQKHSISILG